ncbi:DUF732 domain-containing protein [Mycobacterium sp.]|uniref:DUF732 domain-containing protein n=1 Tax=Mycobacterium sp. TaxID=1785 RepID=UPI0012749047|nr:DUF732 domain-containing protein [Mycobacterium sp.]KAA8960978.1 MAG: DUF732 domain-containing protein [Mycobacterium sp.]
MRDRDTIDSELRRLAAMRRSLRTHGGEPLDRLLDELLDERLGHRAEVPATGAVEARPATDNIAHAWSQRTKTDGRGPSLRQRVLRHLGLVAALPISLVAVAAAVVVMSAIRHPHPAEPPAAVPPSDAPPGPSASSARPDSAAPRSPAPPPDIAERAFIDVLTKQGVPVPNHQYVTTHAHAACDFLAHQPNFAEAARFVQQSSIWDANESAEFVAGAIVSYCPQYEPTHSDDMQQVFGNAVTGVQAIQRDLDEIRDDLEAIRDPQ